VSADDVARDLRRVRTLARTLDSAVGIPGTRVRLGADALLGLFPGLGDALSAALAAFPVVVAVRHRLPVSVVLRMLGNIALDTIIGSVPVLGDLFDVGFKSNQRNAALIERHIERPGHVARESRVLLGVVAVGALVVVVAAVAFGVWIVSRGLAMLAR
jgi:hypothetical protein